MSTSQSSVLSSLGLSAQLLDQLPQAIEREIKRRSRRKIDFYYPDEGPLRRELYVPHQKFFAAGAQYRERLLIAANRIGKSEGVGAYEIACHLTGQYPAWWIGRRFTKPVKAWAAGDTGKTVKEILQAKLLGDPGALGTGMLPGDAILRTTSRSGVPDAIDTVYVRHANTGRSTLTFKSYEQGRESFQGSEQDVIWLDEEPPLSVYTECLIRTMTTNGLVLCTFTPLSGLTDVVLMFLPGGKIAAGESVSTDRAKRFVVTATWDDAPHLSEEVKQELWDSIPPYQRDARSKGIPQLGSGAIFPVPETEISVADFPIPDTWPRAYGMDVGWNRTACIWGAQDPVSKVVYLYSEHYQGREEPSIHAAAIKARGAWIPGVIDPAARGRGQKDGSQLFQDYKDLGLKLFPAVNAVEAGLLEVWQLLSGGQLKVFKSLNNWFSEFRLYRRDDKGHVVKEMDHLMDPTRYLVVSGRDKMIVKPKQESNTSMIPSFVGKWS